MENKCGEPVKTEGRPWTAGSLLFPRGALAGGVSLGNPRFFVYGVALFATGLVIASSYWRAEGHYFAACKMPPPRGQSVYFISHGKSWLKAGSAVTVATCLVLVLDSGLHFLAPIAAPAAPVLALTILGGGIACCLSCWLMRQTTVVAVAAFICLASVVAIAVSSAGAEMQIDTGEMAASLLLLTLLIADHRYNLRLDYKSQNLLYLAENWPTFKREVGKEARLSPNFAAWLRWLRMALALNSDSFEKELQGEHARRLSTG